VSNSFGGIGLCVTVTAIISDAGGENNNGFDRTDNNSCISDTHLDIFIFRPWSPVLAPTTRLHASATNARKQKEHSRKRVVELSK
jgi:hypothetical protein